MPSPQDHSRCIRRESVLKLRVRRSEPPSDGARSRSPSSNIGITAVRKELDQKYEAQADLNLSKGGRAKNIQQSLDFTIAKLLLPPEIERDASY
jgi:hypothetical protein